MADVPYNRDRPQDWPEDFHIENGNYVADENVCGACDIHFYGNKRRVICKICSQQRERD